MPSNKTKRRATKLFDLNAKPLTRDLRRPAKETIQSFGKSWRIPLSNLKRPYIGRAAQRSKKLQRIFSQGFAASDHVVRQLKQRGNPSHTVKPRPGLPFMCDVVSRGKRWGNNLGHGPPMTAMLTSLHVSLIILVGAFLFAAVDWLELNHRLAIIFKSAILAAGGIAIAAIVALRASPSERAIWLDQITSNLRSTSGERRARSFEPPLSY